MVIVFKAYISRCDIWVYRKLIVNSIQCKVFNFADKTVRNLRNWIHTFMITDPRHSNYWISTLYKTEALKGFTFQTFLANTVHHNSTENIGIQLHSITCNWFANIELVTLYFFCVILSTATQETGLYLGVRTCETHGWRKTKETKTF